MNEISFRGRHFSKCMILQSVRSYLAYGLSYRDIEEMMLECGFDVDHSTIHRWVVHYSPQLEQNFRTKKRRPRSTWRLDVTYVNVKGSWKPIIALTSLKMRVLNAFNSELFQNH